MTYIEAVKILGSAVTGYGGLSDLDNEYLYKQAGVKSKQITLDGAFTLEQLEAIVIYWKADEDKL